MENHKTKVDRGRDTSRFTLARRLRASLFKCHETFVCNWINWTAIYAVLIQRNASLMGIRNLF